jgi:hypothetical protein
MSACRWFAAALFLLLAACSRSAPDPEATAAAPPVAPAAPSGEPMDASWQGVLPCADCDGIQTRLHLVADGDVRRFELEETYLAAEGGERFEASGEWSEHSAMLDAQPTAVYRLDIDGAGRWFRVLPDGALEQLDAADRANANGAAHRLQRL